MASNGWTTNPLGDLTVNLDSVRVPVKEADRKPGPYPYYGASGIVDHVDGFLFEGEHLLIAEDGENLRTRQTPIAFIARGKFWVNNHAHIVKGNDRALTRFLSYALANSDISGYLSGSTMPKLTQGNLNRIPILTPPVPIQERIVGVLGALDDKIELNRRMNETLEALARRLFRSWFVDFDPVHAKAALRRQHPKLPNADLSRRALPHVAPEIAELFPDTFEDSTLGSIPKGWAIDSIANVSTRVAMGPFGSDIKKENFVSSGVPVVRGGNLTNGFVDRDFVFVREEKATQLRNANAFPGDIVITHRGTLGQIGLIPRQSRFPRYVVSQSQMLISVDDVRLTPTYLYRFLVSPSGMHQLLANTSQTGVPAIARPTTSVKAIHLVVPDRKLLTAFDGVGTSIDSSLVALTREAENLATIRDKLLPRLLSGQLSTT